MVLLDLERRLHDAIHQQLDNRRNTITTLLPSKKKMTVKFYKIERHTWKGMRSLYVHIKRLLLSSLITERNS